MKRVLVSSVIVASLGMAGAAHALTDKTKGAAAGAVAGAVVAGPVGAVVGGVGGYVAGKKLGHDGKVRHHRRHRG